MKTAYKVAALAVLAIVATATGYLAYEIPGLHASPQTSQTSSSSSSSLSSGQTATSSSSVTSSTTTYSICSGSSIGGSCVGQFNYTFVVSVNYTGPWRLTYNGTNDEGLPNAYLLTGNLTGRGNSSVSVTLTGFSNDIMGPGFGLCARAQKLDGSSSTLILTIIGGKETSLPYGSTSFCNYVVP